MIVHQLYCVTYLLSHLALAYRYRGLTVGFSLINLIYCLWLGILDNFVLWLVPFKNNVWLINIYPMAIVFGSFFYYVMRQCMRKQYIFQYLTHIYHPQKQIFYFGHYHIGISYSLADIIIKLVICYIVLEFHIILGVIFLLFTNLMDTYSYYKGITDNTSEIFHKIVGFLFITMHKPSS